jgi:hypothetical protein
MAQEWCVAYGVLPYAEAERLSKEISHRKLRGNSSPAKKARASISEGKAEQSKTKKQKTVVEDEVDGDTGMRTAHDSLRYSQAARRLRRQ